MSSYNILRRLKIIFVSTWFVEYVFVKQNNFFPYSKYTSFNKNVLKKD